MTASFETVCLGCVFAKDKSKNNIIKQRGCTFDAVSKFKKNNEEVIEATDKNGNEFNVIKNRICQFFRNKKWLKNNFPTKEEIKEAMVIARKEVEAKVDVVMYVDNSNTKEQILEMINFACSEKIQPNQIIIANNSDMRPSELLEVFDNCSTKWRIETITEKDCTKDRSIDIVAKKCDGMFIVFMDTKNKMKLIDKIDNLINEKMKKLLCIDNVCVHRTLFNELRGNFEINIFEKIKKEKLTIEKEI